MTAPLHQPQLIAFDLDGTLIDTAADLAAAANLMLSMLGTRVLPEERIRQFIGRGIEQLVSESLSESLGRSPRPPVLLAATMLFRQLYSQGLFSRSRVYPGVVDTLRTLADMGLTLCCLTNKAAHYSLRLLRLAKLDDYLTFTLCAEDSIQMKPSPWLLLTACDRTGVTPDQMLYVGDSPIDVAAARAAGCASVTVDYGYAIGTQLLAAAPDQVIGDLRELLMLLPLRRVAPSLAAGTGPEVLH